MNTDSRIGIVAIIVEDRINSAEKVNQIISGYGQLIIGRMGIPYRERNLSVISLVVDGTPDQVGAMTGKLGSIQGVSVRSVFSKHN